MTEVSAHSAGYEEVPRVWPFNATHKLGPDVRELLSMHCSWCVLDCGEAQRVGGYGVARADRHGWTLQPNPVRRSGCVGCAVLQPSLGRLLMLTESPKLCATAKSLPGLRSTILSVGSRIARCFVAASPR